MQLHFCGGAREVGASCVLAIIAGKRILFDCGMRMKGDSLPDLRMVQEAGGLDAIVLSHAHMDHSGSLPVISNAYPGARIHLTHPTHAIVRVLLLDSLKLMAQEEEIPVYDRRQVELMLTRIAPQGFGDEIEILDGIHLTFFPAGHILGAGSAYLSSEEGSIFYSGDISVDAQRTVSGLTVPRLRPTVCILETTYGDRLHAARKIEEDRLCESAGERLEQGARVLIPAFAVGRAQEVILTLRAAMTRGQIPKAPIYVDGMVREICRIYRYHPNYLRESLARSIFKGHDPFFTSPVQAVENREAREAILNSGEPCCIVSSSGMLSGGPSAGYAQALASDPEAFIAITGYQDEESPGRKLQRLFAGDEDGGTDSSGTDSGGVPNAGGGNRTWMIQGREIPLKCRLGTFGLSAHADKSQLLGLINQLAPRELFLVHGDPNVIERFGREAQAALRGRVNIPANGASFVIDRGARRAGQSKQKMPAPMNRPEIPTVEQLADLADHLMSHNAAGLWSALDLIHIWSGRTESNREDESAITRRLNESPHFEYDRRRLYLFRAIEAPEPTSEWPLEVNRMLALAGQMFPPESGCYRAGARLEQRIARLFFRFPAVARERNGDAMRDFEKQSGWSVELNQYPDTSYLQPLLERLLERLIEEGAARITKVACHLDRNSVSITLAGKDCDIEALQTAFRQETGLVLTVTTSAGTFSASGESNTVAGAHPTAPVSPAPPDSPAETAPHFPIAAEGPEGSRLNQQQAMQLIDEVFTRSAVILYKQSVKSDGSGPFLELQFLTPALASRHIAMIEDLANETGWRIGWSSHPRQQELIARARKPFDDRGIGIARGPSILPNCSVRVNLAAPIDAGEIETVRAWFQDVSGYDLEIITPAGE